VTEKNRPEKLVYLSVLSAIALALYLSSLHSYLLFHSLIEISTISIGFTLFILTWNARKFLHNDSLKLLGIGYAFIAFIDLLHTLAYKGMNIFTGFDANLPTQLWIAARYLQAATLCAAPLFVKRRADKYAMFGAYTLTVIVVLMLVYSGNFPDCYVEGRGLTPFKIGSEYVITGLLLISFCLFYRNRGEFDRKVFILIGVSLASTIVSELSFTAYVSVYGAANQVGHFAKLAAFYLIYRAILVTGLNEPFNLIFRELGQAQEALRKANETLEEKIRERTAELQLANERLQRELDEHEQTQETLSRYAEELQDLYNNAPCGYHSLDSDGTFLRINDTELRWLGYDRNEVIGRMRFVDIVTTRGVQTFQENFPHFKEQGWIRNLEFELVRKDGSTFPVLVSATAILDDNGAYLMSRSTTYDISERKKVQEQEHLLSTIVQSSDDAIFAKNLEGVILSWNRGAERIYGYRADEVIGQPITMLMPPGQEDEFAGIMSALQRGERIEHYATKRRRKDGRLIFVSLTISPIRDMAGGIVGASSITRDVTEQLRSEEEIIRLNRELEARVDARTNDLNGKRIELEESQRALMNIVEDLNLKTSELEEANSRLQELDRLKSMFIASMSHELRTPLNSIIGFSSILRDEWIGPVNQEQKENLETILRSGKHLLSLINDVIDVSKIEAGRIEVRTEEFDLYELLTEAVQYVDRDIREKGLELKLQIQHHVLRTDKRRLLQCVINLLSNAVKFTEKGEIIISSAIDGARPDERGGVAPLDGGEMVVISVHDTGIGIDEKDIHQLFEPFVRLESALKATVPGTGLGLYLTRKLVVEVLHGDIVCKSELGAGSVFELRIPERIDEKGFGGRG